jgi:hypothetical protein
MQFLGIPGGRTSGCFYEEAEARGKEVGFVAASVWNGWMMMMTARFFGLKTGGCRCRRSGATGSTRHKAG